MALLLNFTVSSGMPLALSWLIAFNYAFENGEMSISQKCGIISPIPKKDKDKKYLKNWRPISLLNNDYKIVTKALALRLEKVLPTINSPNQTGYV